MKPTVKLKLASSIVGGLLMSGLLAAPAMADDHWYGGRHEFRDHDWDHGRHRGWRHRPPVRVVYEPVPAYYYQPRPVVYYPAPVYQPAPFFSINWLLR